MTKRSPLHLGQVAAVPTKSTPDSQPPSESKADQKGEVLIRQSQKGRGAQAQFAHAPRPPSRQGKRSIAGFFSDSTWVAFRQLGIQQRKSNQELLQEALDDLLAKYRKR